LASAGFLLDPRRADEGVPPGQAEEDSGGRAERVRTVQFSPDEEMFANVQSWKNKLTDTCTAKPG